MRRWQVRRVRRGEMPRSPGTPTFQLARRPQRNASLVSRRLPQVGADEREATDISQHADGSPCAYSTVVHMFCCCRVLLGRLRLRAECAASIAMRAGTRSRRTTSAPVRSGATPAPLTRVALLSSILMTQRPESDKECRSVSSGSALVCLCRIRSFGSGALALAVLSMAQRLGLDRYRGVRSRAEWLWRGQIVWHVHTGGSRTGLGSAATVRFGWSTCIPVFYVIAGACGIVRIIKSASCRWT